MASRIPRQIWAALHRLLHIEQPRARSPEPTRRHRKSLETEPPRPLAPPLVYSEPTKAWSLETVPLDIVICVMDYLPPEARAALALTSRTMLYRLGARTLELSPSSRFNLLLLLERDGWFLPDIPCFSCRVFHAASPHYSWNFGDYTYTFQSMRPCQRFGKWDKSKFGCVSLPATIHFNRVATVMRCFRHNLTLFRPEALNISESCEIEGNKFILHYDFAIVNAHLMMKTEALLLPCMDREQLLDRVPAMTEVVERLPWKLSQCCAAVKWTERYPHVFTTQRGDALWRKRAAWIRDPSSNRVLSCTNCYTDYSLGFVDLPEDAGRVCIMTSWKDLGPGITPDDREWASHRVPREATYTLTRSWTAADIFQAFEGSKTKKLDGVAGTLYRPGAIRQKSLDYLVGKGV